METILGPYPPPHGGVEIFTREEAEKRKGFVVGTSSQSASAEKLRLFKKGPFALDILKLFFWFLVNRKRVTRVRAHYATTFGFVAFLVKLFLGKDYTVVCHGSDIMLNLHRNIFEVTTKIALRNAEKIEVVSKALKDILVEDGYSKDKVVVIEERVDKRLFRDLGKDRKDQIIFVGAIKKNKGLDILVDAFIRARDELKNYDLIIVGRVEDRVYYNNIKKMIEENKIESQVEFVGELPYEEIPGILNESKIFVMPSLHEGYGRALEEALECGLHCVATNVGALPEIAARYERCTLVDPSANGVKKGILEVLEKLNKH